jgi:hypothetical protein
MLSEKIDRHEPSSADVVTGVVVATISSDDMSALMVNVHDGRDTS